MKTIYLIGAFLVVLLLLLPQITVDMETYFTPSVRARYPDTRGLRNNNPGNLKKTSITWKGKVSVSTDSVFEQFVTMEYGVRAMYKDILNDISKGADSIKKLITQYAPPSENQTSSYIEAVVKATGLAATDKIPVKNPDFMYKLLDIMIQRESAAKLPQNVILKGISLA